MEDTWESLPVKLSKFVYSTLEKLSFVRPTPVQAACIPLFMKNKDVAAEAETGSGKTLAFVIPVLEMLMRRETPLRKYDIGAVVISPTRELASQIEGVFKEFLSELEGITCRLVIGGKTAHKFVEQYKSDGGHILVATPGRLEALLEQKNLGVNLASGLKALEVLILDEADRLLDMGFEPSINTILSFLPKQRRTGLFSATQTSDVEKLIRAGLRNPVRIVCEKGTWREKTISTEQRTPTTLQNYYMIVESDQKFNQLMQFLQTHRKEKVMVFFSTCASVDYFSKILNHLLKKQKVLSIHSKMKKRNKVVSAFCLSDCGVLLCTDVMARGIDIPEVHWVIQYDPPSSATAFVHRCGRTARIGNHGSALVFLTPHEDTFVRFIEINQKVPLHKMEKLEIVNDYLPKIQTLAIHDRAVFEKGMRAYVSFVQSYAKHECSMIFQLKELDFGCLATGFGLLKIPKMPELKGKSITNFVEVPVDVDSIPYKDKSLEKQRQEQLSSNTVTKKFHKLKKPEAWSKDKRKKDRKRKRKMGKEKDESGHTNFTEEDIDELEEDFRLVKKLKKGKISQDDFDEEFLEEDC